MFQKAVGSIKANFKEFTEFAFKGNLLQLAIGVVLGTAFGDLMKSFVANIFMPIISLPGRYIPGVGQYEHWKVAGIPYGVFIKDFISFVLIALAIFFLMVKVVGWIVKLTKKPGEPAKEAVEKECPFCLSKISIKATRCAHCTSDVAHTLPAVAV